MNNPFREGDLVNIKARVRFDQSSEYVFIELGCTPVYVLANKLELITPRLDIGDTVELPGGIGVACIRGISSDRVWVEDTDGHYNTFLAKNVKLARPGNAGSGAQ